MKYILRILALPFVVGLSFIGLLKSLIDISIGFILHGGEFIKYGKNTRKSIADVLDKLEK
jgi:hypothetical protein